MFKHTLRNYSIFHTSNTPLYKSMVCSWNQMTPLWSNPFQTLRIHWPLQVILDLPLSRCSPHQQPNPAQNRGHVSVTLQANRVKLWTAIIIWILYVTENLTVTIDPCWMNQVSHFGKYVLPCVRKVCFVLWDSRKTLHDYTLSIFTWVVERIKQTRYKASLSEFQRCW